MMLMRCTFAAAVISVGLLLGSSHQPSAAATTRLASLVVSSASAPNACALLNATQVSQALEIASLPGRPPVANNPVGCIWSDDPNGAVSNRRVTLSIIPAAAFEAGKTMKLYTVVPVGGIGDDAYFDILRDGESPILSVRKGTTAFRLRILNGLKVKAFTLDEEKAKETALAKAAATAL